MRFILLLLMLFCTPLWAANFKSNAITKDIIYSETSAADNLHKLDLYLAPEQKAPGSALIWFHGGGLTSGSKDGASDTRIANFWRSQNVNVIAVNYRLAPAVKFPAYLQDAALAVAWVKNNAAKLGVDPAQIYVGGHSAGAWVATMLALDEKYLRAHNIEPKSLAGFISISGQMTTHFTVRKERGLSNLPVIVDDAAPSYYVRTDIPRLLLLIGDHDWPARLEENQLLFAQFTQLAKTDKASFHIIKDRDHNSIFERIVEPGDETYNLMNHFMKFTLTSRLSAE
jgi:acetyl esterase/lipase